MAKSTKVPGEPEGKWYEVALHSIGDAVIATDADGQVTFLNPAAEALTGWRRSEAGGFPLEVVFQIVNEETRATVENPAVRALRDGCVVGLANHTLLISKDGSEHPIDDSAAPIRRANGEVVGVVLVFRDVSERREAERALAESEQRLRLLVEGVQDYAIFTLDPMGIVTSWNSGAERIKGYRAEEIIGKHFSCFYPPEAIATGFPDGELTIAAETGRFENEGWRLRKDGSRFWANVVITAMRDENSVLKGFSKITRDLTERKTAEEVLRAKEERLQALTQAASEAIITANRNGRIVSWNKAATVIFGFREEAILNRPITILLPEKYQEAHRKGFTRYCTTGESHLIGQTVELEGRRADGTEFPIELSLTTWTTRDGQFFTAIIRDIAVRKQNEETARKAERARIEADAMVDLNRRKDQFLAMLSHELRNPLAPILNCAELLQMRTIDDDARKEAIQIIDRQIKVLIHLVDDLLEVSRISTGRITLNNSIVDMRDIVHCAVEAVQPMISERRQELAVTFESGAVWVDADRARLEQVVINLLNNASKYSHDEETIRLTLDQRASQAVLQVVDSGVGIGPALLPVIFDLFTQAEQSLDRSRGGLGIGLSLVQQVIKQLGGTVDAYSEGAGRGSTFTVHLPLAVPPIDDPRKASPSHTDGQVPLKVLVIDDNKDAADTTASLLRLSGHEVQVTYSGQTAIVAAVEFQPDVVLLDIGLPMVDGIEVARRMHEKSELNHARLIALTGYSQEIDLSRIQEAGFDDYLIKPVDLKKIEDVLTRFAVDAAV